MTHAAPEDLNLGRRGAFPFGAAATALFLCGLALRVYVALGCTAKPDYSDMAEYNRMAVERGLGTRSPLYPLFLRAVYAVWGDYNYRAVFVVQAVLSSLVILLMYGMVARMWSRRAGLIAAGMTAVYPVFIAYNLTTLTESLSVLWVALIMAVAASALRDDQKAIAHGALVGFGMMMKPAFLFFVPGILVTTKRKTVFLLVLAAVCAPWLIGSEMRSNVRVPLSDRGVLMFYRSYNPLATGEDIALTAPQGASQLDCLRMSLDFIRHNKLRTLDIINNKIFGLFRADWDAYVMQGYAKGNPAIYALRYGYVVVMVVGFIGLARLYRRDHRAVVLPVLSYLAIIILLSAFKCRYRVLIEPLLIVYASMLLGGAMRPWPIRGQGGP